jgi:hypothetical protein
VLLEAEVWEPVIPSWQQLGEQRGAFMAATRVLFMHVTLQATYAAVAAAVLRGLISSAVPASVGGVERLGVGHRRKGRSGSQSFPAGSS